MLIIIPFSALFFIFSLKSTREMKENYISFMADTNFQIQEKLNMIMGDIDRVSSLHSIDLAVQKVLGKKYKSKGLEYISDFQTMHRLISSSSRLNPFFYEVVYVGESGEYYTNLNVSPTNKDQIEKWIPKARKLYGKRAVSEVYTLQNGAEYISIYRMLLSPITLKENGFVFVNIKLSSIGQHLRKEGKLLKKVQSQTLIIDNQKVIYESSKENTLLLHETELLKAINEKWETIEEGRGEIEINHQKYMLVGQINEATGWKVVQYVPMQMIDEYNKDSVYFYCLTMIPFFLLSLVVEWFLSRKILLPIEKLKQAMRSVEKGNFITIETKKNKDDEMETLLHSYNHMVLQLRESIAQKYIAQMQQKKIEYKMLEAQINPHFLYNTLNLMSSIAEIYEVHEVSEISNSLSEMFRYSIQKPSVVRIEEELEQIQNYIKIQQMRFVGKIKYKCNIEPKEQGYSILKFLLQPLVENAIYHGIEKKESQGTLQIFVEENKEDLFITIQDDGVGMEQSILEGIQKRLQRSQEAFVMQEQFEHLGIENVHYRIKNYYGERYGLSVYSKKQQGTAIVIHIPIVT